MGRVCQHGHPSLFAPHYHWRPMSADFTSMSRHVIAQVTHPWTPRDAVKSYRMFCSTRKSTSLYSKGAHRDASVREVLQEAWSLASPEVSGWSESTGS